MGIRTPDRNKPYNRFRVCRIRPLCHLPIFTTLNLLSVLLAQSKQMLSARAVKVARRVLSPSVRCRVCRLSRTLPSSHIYDSQSVICLAGAIQTDVVRISLYIRFFGKNQYESDFFLSFFFFLRYDTVNDLYEREK